MSVDTFSIVFFGEDDNKFDFQTTDGVYQQRATTNFSDLLPYYDRMIFQDGGYDNLGVIRAPAQVGSISLWLRVYPQDRDVDDVLDDIRAMQNLGLARLVSEFKTSNYSSRFCYARINNINIERDISGVDEIIDVRLTWQVPYPVWHVAGESSGAEWGIAEWGIAQWGLDNKTSVSGLTTFLTQTNEGNADSQPIITIECDAGETCENIRVNRIVNGLVKDYVTYIGVMSPDDTLVINPRAMSATLNGNSVLDKIDFRHPRLFTMKSGDNQIRVNCENASDSASIEFDFYYNFYGS